MPENEPQGGDLREFVAAPEDAGHRLDVFLAEHMPDWSRSQLQQLIRSGLAKMDGQAVRKAGEKVEAGSRISILAKQEPLNAFPEDLPSRLFTRMTTWRWWTSRPEWRSTLEWGPGPARW